LKPIEVHYIVLYIIGELQVFVTLEFTLEVTHEVSRIESSPLETTNHRYEIEKKVSELALGVSVQGEMRCHLATYKKPIMFLVSYTHTLFQLMRDKKPAV